MQKPWCFIAGSLIVVALAAPRTDAETFSIQTEIGPFRVDVPHLVSGGALVKAPAAPEAPDFRPPSVFSAPLPSGSGARALGLAGAFTAIADDATAASWNPGGLMQLQEAEVSVVLRTSRNEHRHRTTETELAVGDDEYESAGINYLSAVIPFRLADRNFVFSLNLQEAYDFTRQFHADWSQHQEQSDRIERSETTRGRSTRRLYAGNELSYIDLTTTSETTHRTVLDQTIRSGLLTDLDFEQDGVLYASTPALAMQVTPRFSAGVAVNFHHDSPFGGQSVQSATSARFRGGSDGVFRIEDTRTTAAELSWTGVSYTPPNAMIPFPQTSAVPRGSMDLDPFTDRTVTHEHSGTRVIGTYEERNTFEDFEGINLTLGGFWNVTEMLTLGGSVDLPWTAEATQTKSTHTRSRTRDLTGRLVDEVDEALDYRSDVEFDFPLRAALGLAVRWSDALTTALDVEYTRWSDFSFRADGGPEINPLDGSPRGESEIDDCWSVRAGAEYLLILARTEIPFRVGLGREQRPAIGRPDEIWQYSLGTGFSIGQGPGRVIVDIAYIYSVGEDVMGSLLPGRDVTTDIEEHEGYVSCIRHF